MKLWTPVGLCSDANDESLPIRACTFGFTTPFSIPPPEESLDYRSGPNHSGGKACVSSLASFWPCLDIGKKQGESNLSPSLLMTLGLEVLNWLVFLSFSLSLHT